ncbi:MAG: hypothetical protein J1E81_01835 [Eubacterium sp.]|nr:hypothetical protein [Eubacterium sp.]
MIKGVSKQILEVTNTDNPYFEKIIFFVKTEHKNDDRSKLQSEAEKLALSAQKPPKIRMNKKQVIKIAFNSVLFTLAGCAISYIISILL